MTRGTMGSRQRRSARADQRARGRIAVALRRVDARRLSSDPGSAYLEAVSRLVRRRLLLPWVLELPS